MNFKTFPWPAILVLSLAGAVMGAVSLTGFLTTMGEFGAWTLVALIWVATVLFRDEPRPFLTLALVGTIAGVWTGVIQGGFAHILVVNNIAYGEAYPNGVVTMDRVVFGVSALGIGVVWGALFGGVAAGVRKWRNRAGALMA